MRVYVLIETEGQFSEKEWAVKGVHRSIQEASVQAWMLALQPHLTRQYLKKWWCDTSESAIFKRNKCRGIGSEHHILVWDLNENNHVGTWYIEKDDILKKLGGEGLTTFENTLRSWLEELELTNKVPMKLWVYNMRWEDS